MSESVDFFVYEPLLFAYQEGKRYTVAYGGRGSGKSLQFGALAVIYATQNPNSRILCVRGTQNKISESSLQVIKDVVDMLKLTEYFDITENTIRCKNGSEFLFYGAKNYNSFKSLQRINLVWVDEATELSKAAWETLIPTIRANNSRFLISFNPEKESQWVYQAFIINEHPEAVVVKMNYYDNPFFPAVLETEMLYDKVTNYQKYLHVWEGNILQKVEGALWHDEWIRYDEDKDYEEMERVVISIDPSGSDSDSADEAGIVVAGKLADYAFVLEDKSGKYTQLAQVKIAVKLYHDYDADAIIVEKNGVGAGIKTIINQYDNTVIVKEVNATRGKLLRAEPIAALYEAGRIFHTKKFTNLEYQMVTYDGSGDSPGALDACVYALTDLLLQKKNKAPKGMSSVPVGTIRF